MNSNIILSMLLIVLLDINDIMSMDNDASRDMTTQDQKKEKWSRRKFKKKRDSIEESTPIQDQNDLSKVRCYKCQKFCHYAFQSSQKKIKRRNVEKKAK